MAEESSLAIKLKLELQDKQGKYLLYFPSPEPETEKRLVTGHQAVFTQLLCRSFLDYFQ